MPKSGNEDVPGERPLERAAETVGRAVRKTMMEVSGTVPERLPAAGDIKKVQTGLKRSQKEYKKLEPQIGLRFRR
jgi:DNA-damage-inducible protein D